MGLCKHEHRLQCWLFEIFVRKVFALVVPVDRSYMAESNNGCWPAEPGADARGAQMLSLLINVPGRRPVPGRRSTLG